MREQVAAILQENEGTLPAEIAKQLGISELEAIKHLPEGMAAVLSGDWFEDVLNEVKHWGSVTTIVEVAGSIFEIKCPFPRGVNKFGYYNLAGKDSPLHGHLKADGIAHIALVSKPFHGMMTHSIQFLDQAGACVFKIYLGRNKDRSFIEGQEEAFEGLKQWAAS